MLTTPKCIPCKLFKEEGITLLDIDSGRLNGQFFFIAYILRGKRGRGLVLTRVSTGIKQMNIPSIDFVFGISGFFHCIGKSCLLDIEAVYRYKRFTGGNPWC